MSRGFLLEIPHSTRGSHPLVGWPQRCLRTRGERDLDTTRRSRPDFDSVSAGSIAQRAILRSDGSRALRDFEISCPALSTHLWWELRMWKGSPPHRRRRRVYGKHDHADVARPFHRTLIPRKTGTSALSRIPVASNRNLSASYTPLIFLKFGRRHPRPRRRPPARHCHRRRRPGLRGGGDEGPFHQPAARTPRWQGRDAL